MLRETRKDPFSVSGTEESETFFSISGTNEAKDFLFESYFSS